MNNPHDYSTREAVVVSGPTPEQRQAELDAQAAAIRKSDNMVKWALLAEAVVQGVSDEIAVSIAMPGVDHFHVDDLGNIVSSGSYSSLAEYVTIKNLETKAALSPAMKPYLTPEQKERTFEVNREETISELHIQLLHFAKNNDMKSYRRVRAEIDAL